MAERQDIYRFFFQQRRFYFVHIAEDDPNFVEFMEGNPDPLSEPETLFVSRKTLLHKAIESFDEALVRRIIEEEAIDLTVVDDNGLTPLMTACALLPNSLKFPILREIFFILLEALPKKKRLSPFSRNLMDVKDIHGHSALEICLYSKNLYFAAELLRRGARTRTYSKYANLLHIFSVIPSELRRGQRPPSWAGSVERYKQIHTEVAYLLYSKKISPFVKFLREGNNPLYASIMYYNATLFKILLGTDVDEDLLAAKTL